MKAYLSSDDKWRMRLQKEELSGQLEKAFINKEDKYFYYHFGVNPVSVLRAAFNNLFTGRKTSGASTITMQVARLLNPKARSYGNKMIEMFRAIQLEFHYSKEEILLMYLNLVPYGGNIEGVKAASRLYFNTPVERLSLSQTIILTIIPNKPTSLRIGKDNGLLREQRDKWLNRFANENLFSGEDVQSALREPVNAQRIVLPDPAPHFSNRLKKDASSDIIKSTLRYPTQFKVSELCLNYIKRKKAWSITNASVLVIDNSNGNVIAYIGSSDFNDKENSGQVDGVRAVRSPGSTLKPLVYATAFDEGLLTPKSIINDVPSDFNGYAPDNFDKKFNGKVTVEKSLAYSLNIPAVKTLEQISLQRFIDKLKLAGFQTVKEKEKRLGYSLILGGCGVTLEELTRCFSSFANAGVLNPLNFYADSAFNITRSVRLLSPSSSYMITDILTQITRPDLPNNFQNTWRLPKVAWKTGTSYGRRDAWSIGYNKKYTVGVWVGNFSGQGVPKLTGADIATPLLFEIFNSIDYNSENQWFFKPEALGIRFVCPETGLPKGEHCESSIADFYLPGVSSPVKCEHLKEYFMSPDEKYIYCSHCLPQSGYKRKLFTQIEPELINFYKTYHIPFQQVPEHNPYCSRIFSGRAPHIIAPVNGKEYYYRKGEKQEIMLKAMADPEVKKLYWYINDKFYSECPSGNSLFVFLPAGEVKISCSDDKGRNADVRILVKNY